MSSLGYLWITCVNMSSRSEDTCIRRFFSCLFVLYVPGFCWHPRQAPSWVAQRQAGSASPSSFLSVLFSSCMKWKTCLFIYSFHDHILIFLLCTGILLGTENRKMNDTKYQHLRKSHLIGEICWQIVEIYALWSMYNLKYELILSPPFQPERDPLQKRVLSIPYAPLQVIISKLFLHLCFTKRGTVQCMSQRWTDSFPRFSWLRVTFWKEMGCIKIIKSGREML